MWHNKGVIYDTLANPEVVAKTITSLKSNGINAMVVKDGLEAKQRVLEMIPEGAEVFTMQSMTLKTLEIDKAINESGKYNSVRNQLMKLNRQTQSLQMQKMGAAPEYCVGSVNAITEDGKVVIASNTGSQLSAYVYGSAHVIWVVGTQKIVPDLDTALKRINDHVLPLESDRINKAYNLTTGSYVSKLLIITREISPTRLTLIFVPEVVGY